MHSPAIGAARVRAADVGDEDLSTAYLRALARSATTTGACAAGKVMR
jgi:hypothetical protein